ncbi:putative conjugal transfer protein TrbF [Synergistales bacterium]|nr:putative conjugal transfer protein TrbF [Synergistales bacterium]
MSFFKKKNQSEKPGIAGDGGQNTAPVQAHSAKTHAYDKVSMAADERARQEIVDNNPWMTSKKRHVDIYHELASSVAQWRLATFTMMILLVLSVYGNISLARSVTIQPYVIQVDEHGYAIPVKSIEPSGVDQRFVSAQIGHFIINSRTRVSDLAAQLLFSENSYKSVSANSNAARTLNSYYLSAPPIGAKNPVSVQILSVIPLSPSSYQASWIETVIEVNKRTDYGYLGTFNILLSPPSNFERLIENPLGIYITDYNVIRSY